MNKTIEFDESESKTKSIGHLLRIADNHLKTTREIVKMAYHEGLKEGVQLARELPDWVTSPDIRPEEGDRVLVYLDNNSIEAYTYRVSNKELMNLFDKHIRAWMYAPAPPINTI